MNRKLLQRIPSIEKWMQDARVQELTDKYSRELVLTCAREVAQDLRNRILSGEIQADSIDEVNLNRELEIALQSMVAPKLKQVINGTGVVLHTNLGRAVLPEEAAERLKKVAMGYCNLEFDLATGKRGERYTHVEDILLRLTGAESAIVVNNNAAAVLLVLDTLGKGREVIISRGELVEIGGSFRVPEVMEKSGAILREVGTTNKTRLKDYEERIHEGTALLLKVHPSNFRIEGFTEEVPSHALAALGRKYGIPVFYDAGSGFLLDKEEYGEPIISRVIAEGVDIATFSGDKLLGGPQAGIIVGKEKYISQLKRNPLLRALRIDKLTLCALEQVLLLYLTNKVEEIPTWKMLTASREDLEKKVALFEKICREKACQIKYVLGEENSQAGGGSLPGYQFPSPVVYIDPPGFCQEVQHKLLAGDQPVVLRIKEDKLVVDFRTVKEEEIASLVETINRVVGVGE